MPEEPDFNTSHSFRGTVPDAAKIVPLQTAGYRIVEDRKVSMTKALCEKILALDQVPGDRNLIDAHVEFLMQHMMRGTFLYENHVLASALCKENGKEYRINSQHTCWAAWELEDKGVPIAHGKSRYLRYEADTLADVRQLYSLYDRLKARSKSNVIIANLFGTDEFEGVGQDALKRVAAAFAFWKWDTSAERSRHDSNEIGYLMQHDYLTVCRHVLAFAKSQGGFGTPDTAPFRRASVMGSMFEIFDAAPQKAVEFWTTVCEGLNLTEKTDPRYKLRMGLMSNNVMSASPGTVGKKRVDSEVMYRWGIFAWNAWRRGDPLHALRAPTNTPRPRATRKAGKRSADDAAE